MCIYVGLCMRCRQYTIYCLPPNNSPCPDKTFAHARAHRRFPDTINSAGRAHTAADAKVPLRQLLLYMHTEAPGFPLLLLSASAEPWPPVILAIPVHGSVDAYTYVNAHSYPCPLLPPSNTQTHKHTQTHTHIHAYIHTHTHSNTTACPIQRPPPSHSSPG